MNSREFFQKYKYEILLLLTISVCLIAYSYFFFCYDFPFRKAGFDTYHHIGLIEAFKEEIGTPIGLDPDMFPYLYRSDPHLGINFVFMSSLSSALNFSDSVAIFIFAIVNIILLIVSLYIFVRQYTRDGAIAIVSICLILSYTSAHEWGATGFFSITDLVIIASYPAIFAFSLTVILLTINLRYLENPSKRLLMLQFLILLAVIISHILTAFVYVVALGILLLSRIITERKLDVRILLLVISLSAAFLLALLWPFYNWLDVLIMSSPIQSGPPPVNVYSTEFFIQVLRLTDFGGVLLIVSLIFMAKRKDVFMILWLVGFLMICFSFLLPFRPPLYWRFVPWVKIPIIIGFVWAAFHYYRKAEGLPRFNRKKYAIPLFIVGVAIFFIASTTISIIVPLATGPNVVDEFSFLRYYDDDRDILLTYDPYESYAIQGLTDFQVIHVPISHLGDVSLWEEVNRRSIEIKNIYENGTALEWQESISEYHVNMILLFKENSAYNSEHITEILESIGGKQIYVGEDYILIQT
jgi:hypothetical protein